MADKTEDFLNVFRQVYPDISSFPGCSGLSLLRDENNPEIFFTYSTWDKAESLEAYRNSILFKTTWAKTKILFAHKAEAWSVSPESFRT